MLKMNPKVLFLFGDNLEESGYGGQAKQMRGEPNAVGIPTKRKPTNGHDAYFYERDIDEVKELLEPIFLKLNRHIKSGGVIIAPAAGVGTGFARLQHTAPNILAYIAQELKSMSEFQALPPKKKVGRPPKKKDNDIGLSEAEGLRQ